MGIAPPHLPWWHFRLQFDTNWFYGCKYALWIETPNLCPIILDKYYIKCTASYAGQLLAPVEGFGRVVFCPSWISFFCLVMLFCIFLRSFIVFSSNHSNSKKIVAPIPEWTEIYTKSKQTCNVSHVPKKSTRSPQEVHKKSPKSHPKVQEKTLKSKKVKCTIFWLIRGLMVNLDLYAQDFPKKYL